MSSLSINSISPGFSSNQMVKGNKPNSANSFDKQISRLQEQIKSIKENDKMDDKSKKLKVQEIEEKIKELQKQRQAKEADDLKKSMASKSAENADQTNAADKGALYSLTKTLVSADSSIKKIS